MLLRHDAWRFAFLTNPLVSILIPTLNSQSRLGACLDSIACQSYPYLEVIVSDGLSRDNTATICKERGVRLIACDGGLLRARYKGFSASAGDFVLLLDSDQVLERTAIERAVVCMKRYDFAVLEENSMAASSWVEKLFAADKRMIARHWQIYINPVRGVLLPRIFQRKLLARVFSKMSSEVLASTVAHDHAIISYEAFLISRNVGFVPRAVSHFEPKSLRELWRKNFRYGITAATLNRTKEYQNILKSKAMPRFVGELSGDQLSSLLLFGMKSIPYSFGLVQGMIVDHHGQRRPPTPDS